MAHNNIIAELKNRFVNIQHSSDFGELLPFCSVFRKDHSAQILDFHYSLLHEKELSNDLFQMLRRSFNYHDEAGELYLLEKIKTEPDPFLKGDILQILGNFKYRNGIHLTKTAEYAREFLRAPETTVRCRAIFVLGWVGEEGDVDRLAHQMVADPDNENRGWAASALMQLFFHKPAIQERSLRHLKKALLVEQDPFTLECMVVAVQEITKKRLGLSALKQPGEHSDEQIQAARKKAERLLCRIIP